jgi:hypothetical protein
LNCSLRFHAQTFGHRGPFVKAVSDGAKKENADRSYQLNVHT